MPLSIAAFAFALLTYRVWTRPKVMATLAILFSLAYFGSVADSNFYKIITKPDNVPITLLIFITGLCTWSAFRQSAINDENSEKGLPLIEAGSDDKVLVWPDLVYTELIALVLCTAVLIIWAIVLKARSNRRPIRR